MTAKGRSRTPAGMVPPGPDPYAGGAQRASSVATGFLTGESTWNPLRALMAEFMFQISGLRNHDLAGVDSRRESREATSRNPVRRWAMLQNYGLRHDSPLPH